MVKSKSKKITPTLYKSIFQIKFKPQLNVFDSLVTIAQKYKDFPHWETDRMSIVLFDPDKRCSIAIAHDSFSFTQDSPDLLQEQEQITKLISIIPTELKIETYLRFGFRRWHLTAWDSDFSSLVNISKIKLLSHDSQLNRIFSNNINDTSYIVVSTENKCRIRTVVGPMRKAEFPSFIPFDKEHHLPLTKKEETYMEVVKRYPEVAMYMDIDIFRQGDDLDGSSPQSFVEYAREKISKMTEDLNDYLFETKVKEENHA